MSIFVSVFCGLYAVYLAYACLRGGYHMAKAAQLGDRPRLKTLALAEFRIILNLAACCLIAATQGKSIRLAAILLIGAALTRLPEDWRVLRR